MRLVVQRVKEATVEIGGEICGKIEQGLLVFLGIHKNDQPEDTLWLVSKLVNLRIFEDEKSKMNLNIKDIKGEALIVSQFTLYADCANGRRPDFFESAPGPMASGIYDKFINEVARELGRVQSGRFGAEMLVSLINDGPVTLIIDGK